MRCWKSLAFRSGINSPAASSCCRTQAALLRRRPGTSPCCCEARVDHALFGPRLFAARSHHRLLLTQQWFGAVSAVCCMEHCREPNAGCSSPGKQEQSQPCLTHCSRAEPRLGPPTGMQAADSSGPFTLTALPFHNSSQQGGCGADGRAA